MATRETVCGAICAASCGAHAHAPRLPDSLLRLVASYAGPAEAPFLAAASRRAQKIADRVIYARGWSRFPTLEGITGSIARVSNYRSRWDYRFIIKAALSGNLEVVRYLHENNFPARWSHGEEWHRAGDERNLFGTATGAAAAGGHLTVYNYLTLAGYTVNRNILCLAVSAGHMGLFRKSVPFLPGFGFAGGGDGLVSAAARSGDPKILDECVKYLGHGLIGASVQRLIQNAIVGGSVECLDYAERAAGGVCRIGEQFGSVRIAIAAAAGNGHLAMLKHLAERRQYAPARDKASCAAALVRGRVAVAQWYLEAGAFADNEGNANNEGNASNASNDHLGDLVYDVAHAGHIRVLQLLKARGLLWTGSPDRLPDWSVAIPRFRERVGDFLRAELASAGANSASSE